MPKLPSDFVKAPTFDNPLRATAGTVAIAERKLVLKLDAATWDAVWAASEREHTTPEALAVRALERFLNGEPPVATAQPAPGAAPRLGLRAQLVERVQEQIGQNSIVQRVQEHVGQSGLVQRVQERVGRSGFFQRVMALRSFLRELRA